MAELRTQPRVAVHYRVTLRHAGVEGRGTTENISETGAMLSVDIDPPLRPGDMISLDIDLPDSGVVRLASRVSWISTVLPGMTGVAFEAPVAPELLVHIAQLAGMGIERAI